MFYLGTMESPPLRVVGSSSKIEEMSMPSGTGTKVYMIFSCGARRRPRNASLSASSWSKKTCSEREQSIGSKRQQCSQNIQRPVIKYGFDPGQ